MAANVNPHDTMSHESNLRELAETPLERQPHIPQRWGLLLLEPPCWLRGRILPIIRELTKEPTEVADERKTRRGEEVLSDTPVHHSKNVKERGAVESQ